MDKLPLEVLTMIFDFLPLDERAKLREVSRCFKEAVEYNLKSVTQIEFKCYSPDASAQNYVSRTSKRFHSFGKSFWSFINSYCGDSIEINADGYDFNTKDILHIARKLKFITCECIGSYDEYDAGMFNHFSQLEGFQMYYEPDQDYEYIYPWCTSLLAQHRERKGKKILCLSLPCNHPFDCGTNRTKLPVGLRRLMLNCNLDPDFSPHPPVTPEVSWSLVELRIDGLPNMDKFSPNFFSLKRLTFMTETVEEKPIRALIHMFAGAIGQLEEFTFVGDVSARAEREIYTLAAHGKQLRTFRFIYDFDYELAGENEEYDYDTEEEGEEEEEEEEEEGEEEGEEEVMNVELISLKLKRLVIKTRRPIAVKVATKILHHFEIRKAPSVVSLDLDCRHLAHFELVRAEISFNLPQLIASAKRLWFLILRNLKLPHESVARIIRSVNENRIIRKVHLKNLLNIEGPISAISKNQIEYASHVRSDFALIMSDSPVLEEASVGIPDLVTVLDDNIRVIKIEWMHDLSINLTRLDGTRCSVRSSDYTLQFYFRQAMSNLRIFSVYVQAITLPLVSHLETHCHNVRGVQVTGTGLSEYREVSERWAKWIASLRELRVIFGYFTPNQMTYILGNLKTNKLVVNIDNYYIPRARMDDRLHELIIDLLKRKVLVKHSFPWPCNHGDVCPLFDPPCIEFDEMESYV